MKLVPDAVRDIMLYLEENLTLEVVDNKPEYSSISYLKLADELVPSKHYSKEEVVYAIQQLCQCDMIKAHITTGKSRRYITCDIYDISWTGHEFLNNIRPQTVWEATKEKATKLGGMSIKALAFLSSTIIQAIASNPELINSIVKSIQ